MIGCGALAVVGYFAISATAIASPPDARKLDEPVRCESDAECPHLACGPCDAGTPITRSMLGGPECAVNPCLDASAVCNEKHTCEIGPRTRKNPAAWRQR
jgi:hypothetical protein